jgi:hypothetical protein
MKRVVLILMAGLMFNGCAHKTIHEQCSDEDTASHYRDYDQCYSELSAKREHKRQAWANAFKPAERVSASCSSRSIGGTTYTDCN